MVLGLLKRSLAFKLTTHSHYCPQLYKNHSNNCLSTMIWLNQRHLSRAFPFQTISWTSSISNQWLVLSLWILETSISLEWLSWIVQGWEKTNKTELFVEQKRLQASVQCKNFLTAPVKARWVMFSHACLMWAWLTNPINKRAMLWGWKEEN